MFSLSYSGNVMRLFRFRKFMMSLEWDIDLDLAKKLDCTEYHLGVTGEEKVLSSWFNGLAKTNIYPQRLLRSDRGKGRESDLSCWFSIYSLDKLRCLSAHTHTHTHRTDPQLV